MSIRTSIIIAAAAMLIALTSMAVLGTGEDCPRGSVTASGIAWCR